MNTIVKRWSWVVVSLMFLFVMEVSAHAQEPIPTPVAIPLSQHESLEINEFSFDGVCNDDTDDYYFDDCMSQIESCQDFYFDGTCVNEFCRDFYFDSHLDLDECMSEACRDFYFDSADPDAECPIDNSCDNDGAVSCEIEVCSNTLVNDCFDGFNAVCDSGLDDFYFDDCVTAICNRLRDNPTSCPFQDCISQGLDASECENLVCGAGYDLPFCTGVSIGQQPPGNVPLAVQTSGITAAAHRSMVMMVMLFSLLSMASFASYRK